MVRKKRTIYLILALCVAVCVLCSALAFAVPDGIVMLEGDSIGRFNSRWLSFDMPGVPVGRAGALVDGGVVTQENDSYTAQARLFGVLPVGTVDVDVVDADSVLAGGTGIGVRIYTGGLLVVGVTDFKEKDGSSVCPPREADVRNGDLITAVNGEPVDKISDFSKKINQAGGEKVTLTLQRNGKTKQKTVTPRCDATDGKYKLGLWVRDSTAGIGTLTFVKAEDGAFGALGHGISDTDTGTLLPVGRGNILPAEIVSVKRGEKGSPGELRGMFAANGTAWGDIFANTDYGLYGRMDAGAMPDAQAVPVAGRGSVVPGAAQIRCCVDGNEVQSFDIMIERVSHLADAASKGMVIHVTDPKLLDMTGGIVQGMSGSPIIQNGNLIGAVTHVFVNDPTRGYGIFIENMLSEAEKVK